MTWDSQTKRGCGSSGKGVRFLELKIISRHDRVAANMAVEARRLPPEGRCPDHAEEAYVGDGIAVLDLARMGHPTFNLQWQMAIPL
jgi:hypothetical protein